MVLQSPCGSPTLCWFESVTRPIWLLSECLTSSGRTTVWPIQILDIGVFSSSVEHQRDLDRYNKHLFVHIGQSSPSYSDPYLEAVDIRQNYDKFPEKKGGLKELFERGPSNAFFLVKFSADLNTNIKDEGSAFYGVSSQYESPENMIITCSTKVCSFGKQVVEKVECLPVLSLMKRRSLV